MVHRQSQVHWYTEINGQCTLVHRIKVVMYLVHSALLVHMYTELNWPCTHVHGIKMAMYAGTQKVFSRLFSG